jgi:iron complex outermembrane receptor protein
LASKPLQGLSFTGGYSFNETKYVKSNTFIEGSLLRYNPRHTANMGFQYKIESGKWQGFQAGVVGVYIGQRYAGRSTRVTVANDAYQLVEIPSYVQVDFTLGYAKKHFALRGKLANIANVLSYNVHDDNSVNPIAPRNFSLSASYRF